MRGRPATINTQQRFAVVQKASLWSEQEKTCFLQVHSNSVGYSSWSSSLAVGTATHTHTQRKHFRAQTHTICDYLDYSLYHPCHWGHQQKEGWCAGEGGGGCTVTFIYCAQGKGWGYGLRTEEDNTDKITETLKHFLSFLNTYFKSMIFDFSYIYNAYFCRTTNRNDRLKFSVNTQISSNVHISSGTCPEGMSDLRHLWLAGREGWRKEKGEGMREDRGKVLTLTPSLCAANTGTN